MLTAVLRPAAALSNFFLLSLKRAMYVMQELMIAMQTQSAYLVKMASIHANAKMVMLKKGIHVKKIPVVRIVLTFCLCRVHS